MVRQAVWGAFIGPVIQSRHFYSFSLCLLHLKVFARDQHYSQLSTHMILKTLEHLDSKNNFDFEYSTSRSGFPEVTSIDSACSALETTEAAVYCYLLPISVAGPVSILE